MWGALNAGSLILSISFVSLGGLAESTPPKKSAKVALAKPSGETSVKPKTTKRHQCPDYKIPAGGSENSRFQVFLQNSWEDGMKDRPEWGYDLGFEDLGDKWTDDSLEAIQLRKNKIDCLEKAFRSIQKSKLSQENRTHYDVFQYELQLSQEARQFPGEFLVLNQLSGPHTDVVDTLLDMPKKNRQEVEKILSRLEKIPTKLFQNRILLEEGLKQKVTPPQITLQKIESQFDALLTARPQDSVLYKPFLDLKNLDEKVQVQIQQKALQILQEKVLPAFKEFKDFVVKTYIPQTRKTLSVQELPQGSEWYKFRIKSQTTTDLTAEQIHELGQQEVTRILLEMEKVKAKAGFKGDLKAFNRFLLEDSQFYYKKPEDLMRDYRDIAKRIDGELPKLFKTLPRLPYGVREIPAFKAASSPTAYYMPGSPSAGRAGFFEANTYDLKARPKWGMEALTLHEAVPGHHLQIARAQELSNLPEFRKYGGYTAFVEGWALYAEFLGEEMGFYRDPYSKYGQLTYEMWRAVRLVVDTGLHSKGWTRDQAIQFFQDHLPKSRLEIEVEVDRYIVWPGQALAYKIGQLEIQKLRKMSEEKLGEKFNVREFHDMILGGGALPLPLLKAHVNGLRF